MKRSYKQNCALAHALDLVGERWTLLIVRELLTGPMRYGELAVNLPGMGTNLLAARLRNMQRHGLVDKGSGKYRLTPKGTLLEPAVHALVRFGLAMNVAPQPENLHRNSWDTVALKALYRPDIGADLHGRYRIELDGVPFCVEISRTGLDVTQNVCDGPVAGITLRKSTARDIAAGRLTPIEAEADGALVREGDPQQAILLMAAFGMTP